MTVHALGGPVEVTLVPAEGGRLVFVRPRLALVPDTTYVLTIDGATDARGVLVTPASVTFTTRAGDRPADMPDKEAWSPHGSNGWRSHRPDSPWRTLKPLAAPPGVTALAGQVPLLDTAHQVRIPSPTTQETVVTTPLIPGLELHLPAGTTIVDEDHNVVRAVSITPSPLDRTPFPLPGHAMFTMFFTIQPGGAYLRTSGSSPGAWLVYPRQTEHLTGAKLPFYNYDPEDKGWFVYGLGTVTPTRIVPDPPTRIYAFTGASFDSGPQPAVDGQARDGQETADPVDPATGAFIMEKTDLSLPDVMPLALTRTYNSLDNSPANGRPFGIGMTHADGLFQWSASQYSQGDLIMPDGSRVHYTRISDPNGAWYTTVMECQNEPTAFYKARLRVVDGFWEYTLKDGTVYVLGHSASLQRIRDRDGNETRLTWSRTNEFGAGVGNLLRVASPNGRWIQFTYDTNLPVNRITDATDNIGRTVHYTYDANGHLETVTDPERHVTRYTWDANHRMRTIKDGRNIVYLTNEYDASGRVVSNSTVL